MLKFPRILYFIQGPVPTKEAANDAAQYGSNLAYRNAALVGTEGTCEPCDGVAGAIPALYKNLPHAKVVIDAHMAKIAYKAPVAAEAGVPAVPVAPVIPPVPVAPVAPAAPAADGWGKTV